MIRSRRKHHSCRFWPAPVGWRPTLRAWVLPAVSTALLSLVSATTAQAETSVDTDVGLDAITTNDESMLGCDVDYDRQGLLAVRPTDKERSLTLAGVALGRGRLADDDSIKPIEASGKATLDWQAGEHKLSLGLGAAYINEDLWGCAATIAAQLQRQRDIQNKVVLPGNRLHTRTGHALYAYGKPEHRYSLIFDTTKQTGDDEASTSTLDGRLDHNSRVLKTYVLAGTTLQTGNFDNFTEVHCGGGARYQSERPLEVGAETLLALRNTSEQRATTTLLALYHLSRELSEHTSLTDKRVRHSTIASERMAESGLLYTGKVWDFDTSANRATVDDAQRHASSFYKGKIGYALAKRQKLSVVGSYGSEQPALERFMSSSGIAYNAVLGSDASRPGHGTPRLTLVASYLATRLVDYTNYGYTVRQLHVGFLATF